MSIKKKTISAVRWSLISKIVNSLSAILKVSILARLLEKEDFGLMAIVTFVLGVLNLFMDMGLTSAILHKQDISKNEYSSLYWVNLIFSIFLFLLIFLLAPVVSSFYNEDELRQLLPLMGFSLLLAGLGRQFKTIEQKALDFKRIAKIEMIGAIGSLAVSVALAYLKFGVYALVYGALSKFLIDNLFFFGYGLRKFGLKLHLKWVETKPFLKIGIYQVGGQIITYFNYNLDIIIIGKIFGSDVLGVYSLAKQLVNRPSALINPIITRVAAPVLAKYQNDVNVLKTHYLRLLKIMSSFYLPIYLIFVIFAPLIVEIFYGPGFEDLILLTRILSVFMFVKGVTMPIGSLVVATGRTDLEFKWNLFFLFVMPLFILAGSIFSIEGVAVSVSLSRIIFFVPIWWFIAKRLIHVDLVTYTKAIIPDFKLLYKTLVNFVHYNNLKKSL